MIKKIFTAIVIVSLSTCTFTQAMTDEQVDSNRVDYCFNALPAQFYHDRVEEFYKDVLPTIEDKDLAIDYMQQLCNACRSLISLDEGTFAISLPNYEKSRVVYKKYLTCQGIPEMIKQRNRHSPCHDSAEVSDISGISMKSGLNLFYTILAGNIAKFVTDNVMLSICVSTECISKNEYISEREITLIKEYEEFTGSLTIVDNSIFQAKLQEFHEKDFCALHLLHAQRFLAMVLGVVK
jgi:hypothetical protein